MQNIYRALFKFNLTSISGSLSFALLVVEELVAGHVTPQYLGGTETVGWEGFLNILIVVVTNLAQGLNPCAKCKIVTNLAQGLNPCAKCKMVNKTF